MKLLNPTANPLFRLNSLDALSGLLEVKKGHLLYICYKRADVHKYKSFEIPKKNGGIRKIDAPLKGLRLIQNRLAAILTENIEFKSCVKAFVKGEGIFNNAVLHKKSDWVLNVDVKDFFGSINFGRVRAVFIAKPFEMHPDVASVVAQICIFQNSLPQGAATSPVVANIVASMLDNKIIKHINGVKSGRLVYSRYADDITISAKRFFPSEIAHLSEGKTIVGESLVNLFSRSGFVINDSKSRLQPKINRQEVTGLVVNKKVNIPSEYKNKLRSAISQWILNPKEAERKYFVDILGLNESEFEASATGENLKRNIYGRLSFMSMVKGKDDPTYLKLILKMAEHDDSPPKFVRLIRAQHNMYDVFICHASEDKAEIAEPLYHALTALGLNVFYDAESIEWGDSLIETINKGLYKSKYVIAIMTDNSVVKKWPQKEINAVLNSDISGGQNRLLPLIHGDAENILSANFLMSDKLYEVWKGNAEEIAGKVKVKIEGRAR
ncbi:TIR domain-containing anti-phage reverse transcriptase [Pseudomonas sp. v388]|uniref:TIR domain-containing anti-phage reverse transcriptase n=1 Tax=Pseudomonas sp. v388 TaxID=2479849 RepID=UPI00131564A0|nr:TIR domain-containing anti-phage reverse transcriptase [Pseudomonas sp. v388]